MDVNRKRSNERQMLQRIVQLTMSRKIKEKVDHSYVS